MTRTGGPPRPGLVGRSVPRREDPRLLTGRARFVDDVDLPGTVHLAFARSPLPHAAIRAVDTSAARALPGVHAAWTIADVDARGLGDLPIVSVQPGQRCLSHPVLARERVRYVGEPLAVVAADDRYLAEDAVESIELDLEPLPAVTDATAAMRPDAPLLHPDWGDNGIVTLVAESGDVERSFADADVVVRERLRSHRYTSMPMETRGAMAHVEADGTLVVRISTQAPHRVRTDFANRLGWPEGRLRVVCDHVGGGFGLKDNPYEEEVLVAAMAVALGRPVKWIEDRHESFVASVHAREQLHDVELAARADGTLLGMRDRILGDHGARLARVGVGPLATTLISLPGPYRMDSYRAEATAVATNKVPSGGYRGFGMTQAAFVTERMMDRLARELDLDPAELRRRNLIRPEELPATSPAGMAYDSGDYPAALDRALELVEYDARRERQASLRAAGRLPGLGLCLYVEVTGLAPSAVMGAIGLRVGGYESVDVSIDTQGRVTVATGMMSTGQGHATTLAQLAADALGVPLDQVTVVQGDTSRTPYAAAGSIGSRAAVVGGAAVNVASTRLREKVVRVGAHLLEAAPEDVDVVDGAVHVRGSRSAGIPLARVAEAAYLAHDLPDDVAPGLVESEMYDPPALTFAYAAHAAAVEVHRDTGRVEIVRYAVVHDCGTMINPMIVEGQVVGGVAQGLGGALLEELVYDDDGQLLTTSFLDYVMPTASGMPSIALDHLETPAPHIPGGMKGAGEGGAIAPPAAVANAVEDALSPLGVEITETPLTPARIWELIHG